MERSEFSAHRVLVLGAKSHAILLLRSILGNVGVGKAVHVEHPTRALDLLRMEHLNAIFFDPAVEIDGQKPFMMAARRDKGMLNPMVPIFVLQEHARRLDVEKARDAGATDVLTTPISPRTVMTKLRAASLSPRAFIAGAEFFGPDRRAPIRPNYYGSDRRRRAPKKARVDFTAV
jgi:two-component system, chemotaxis family, chemotaxis protein CheY